MSTTQPSDADRELNDLKPVFDALLGPGRWDAIFKELTSDPKAFFDSPATWQARFTDRLKAAFGTLDSEAVVLRLLPYLPTLMATSQRDALTRAEAEGDLVNANPATIALREHVVNVGRRCGSDSLRRLFPKQDALSRLNKMLGGAPGLGRMLAAGTEDPDAISYEEHARAMAGVFANMAERYYRPLLVTALSITRLPSGGSVPPSHELGKLMSECRLAWQTEKPQLLGMLDDDLRVIRNSEAHRNTMIDPRAQTILFVNNHPTRGRETVGPWTRDQLADKLGSTLTLARSIEAALSSAARRLGVELD